MDHLFLRYNRLTTQAKSAIWYTACSILQKGISFIAVPIFTRLLTTEEYGIYSLYLSWLQILTIVTSLYLYHGVFNNGMTKYEDDRDTYISSMQMLTILITTFVFVVYIIGNNYWNNLIGLTTPLMVMMFAEMLVTPSLHFWSGRQRFELRYKRLVGVTLGKSFFNPILGFIFVLLYSKDRATARVASVVITEIIVCGIVMVIQFKRADKLIRLEYWKYAVGLAIPLLPHYLSGMILNQGDRVMIDHMVGKSEVAYYSVAYSIGMLVHIVTSAVINSFTPWMYMKIKYKDCAQIKRTINILLIIISIVAIVLMMCSPELVLIFGSEKYSSAVYVIPPVAASVFFVFLYNLLAIPQFYFEKTKFLSLASIVAAVVNIFLNYIFINIFGFIAAGYTTLTCYVLYSIGHYIVSRYVLKRFFDGEELYDLRFILCLSLITISIGVACNLIFDYWYIRYAIMLVVMVILFIKREIIFSVISNFKNRKEKIL